MGIYRHIFWSWRKCTLIICITFWKVLLVWGKISIRCYTLIYETCMSQIIAINARVHCWYLSLCLAQQTIRELTAVIQSVTTACHVNKAWTTTSTHWGRVTHICASKLTIIGSDNGLSPSRHQAIIWTNAGILLFGPLWTNFSEI